MAKKKTAQTAQTAPGGPEPLSGSLIICRNKHWRYISSFHGPWLQLPPEILDSVAHQNYMMPPPRLVDPAVFYDVVRIRKAVDEAAQDSVRASTGVINTARMDPLGGGGGGAGGGHGGATGQLSKERVFKIRQKAVKLLARSFELDEVAASVATMQATSTVEDVAAHVVRRDTQSTDAQYVHFFHEKVPSREMEQHTSLDSLTQIIVALPMERQAPPLRTRAVVQIFKQQWEGAVRDLTAALRIVEDQKRTHQPNQQELELASRMRDEQKKYQAAWNRGPHREYWRSVPQLKEADQPTGLEQQLLFNRAGVYLTMACHSVHAALDGLEEHRAAQENGGPETNGVHAQAHDARLEARKKVKMYARRALKDYLAFLSHFDYTPGLPVEVTNEMMRRVHDLANGNKTGTPPHKGRVADLDGSTGDVEKGVMHSNGLPSSGALVKHVKPRPDPIERGEDGWPRLPTHKIYAASALFAEKPPADLPPFPSDDAPHAATSEYETLPGALRSREAVTYHPLLTDALHSLLLAHSLLQTSPTELLRHAHNAARLARVADGYPVFQAARSPARADWIEVLRRANNWLGLETSWQKLCAPAPLPPTAAGCTREAARRESRPPTEESAEQKMERIKQESIIDALADDRVVDQDSFEKAVRARERRALEDEQGISGPLKDKDTGPETGAADHGAGGDSVPRPKRWAQDENGKEYPISTERAETVVRWIKEAPLSVGGAKKKKRPAGRRKPRRDDANGDAVGLDPADPEEDGPD